MKEDEKPIGLDVEILLIDGGRVIGMDKNLVPIEVNEPIYGIGSGSDYARGARASGKSAREAIENASRFDPSTNEKIDEINADPKATRRSKA